jgi:hypothetical protein
MIAVTSAATRRRQVLRWLAILAPACVTMIFAGLATWVLIVFLAVRDHLGLWNLTVYDSKGAVVGHGRADFVATRWSPRWSKSAPFLSFDPILAHDAGVLTMTASGRAELDDFNLDECDFHLVRPNYFPSEGRMDVYLSIGDWEARVVMSLQGNGKENWCGFHHENAWSMPFRTEASR